jgi:uncharacterized coiled-coil protein SlyX
MADFIRGINQMTARDRQEAVKWREQADILRKRLEQYEQPQVTAKPYDPTPPPEASG